MPFSCAASSASAICRAIVSASRSGRPWCAEPGPPCAGDSFGEGLAFHQFQDETAHAVGLFDAVDGADVRVIQRGEHPRLALEARAPLGIRRERRRQDFDRHLAPKRLVVRAVDLAHPTNAEQ